MNTTMRKTMVAIITERKKVKRKKKTRKMKKVLVNKCSNRILMISKRIYLSSLLMKSLKTKKKRKKLGKKKKVSMKMKVTEKKTTMKKVNISGVKKAMNGTGTTRRIRRLMSGATLCLTL